MVHYLGMRFSQGYESSVADVKDDGVLQNVLIEERYNRKKYSGCYPVNGIIKITSQRILEDEFRVSEYYKKGDFRFSEKLFNNLIYVKTQPLMHHLCHAYETFYTSGFDRAAILVVDGFGDNIRYNIKEKESITLYHKVGRNIKELKKYYMPNSLGNFYEKARTRCGFSTNEEGHFMGLSAYGKPFSKRIIRIKNGEFEYCQDVNEVGGQYAFNKNSVEIINSINFAATIQRDLNECVLELVKDIKNMTKEDNLCLSGGVFNNVITNNLICESGIFKNVWCSPTPGDFGLSIGEAYITYEASTENLLFQKLGSAYKGIEMIYSDDNVLNYLISNNIKYREISCGDIAGKIANGQVLAWFQGASELGRRALGHRSLIANPEYPNMYRRLSGKIKGRAPYRPLACTVPDELFDLMFEIKNKDLTEYMLRAIPIKEEIRNKVQACIHIDGTTRPQRLRKEINPEFYDVIMDFYKQTGVPCIVNTSLNGGGEPIIESLDDLCEFLYNHKDVNGVVINGKYYFENKEFDKVSE